MEYQRPLIIKSSDRHLLDNCITIDKGLLIVKRYVNAYKCWQIINPTFHFHILYANDSKEQKTNERIDNRNI